MAKKRSKRGGPMPKLPGYTLADMMSLKRQSCQDVVEYAKSEHAQIMAARHAQRVMWGVYAILADNFGFTQEQLEELEHLQAERAEVYRTDMAGGDQDYADECLRREASGAVGHELHYYGEAEGLPVNMDLSDAARELVYGADRMLQAFSESEGRLY